ncbi:Stk1 family PASTA domain-containing Ser/Thr kinase [Halalkalibacterium ligniniphilum]|uniref:Stk1 family PASTA domain-containing Ser/Thr kinase n=1 Tax=Halalkalibacterium ligniniphilum TaxID=1134413 RepID=UPI000347B344|nr:Stk1 family PASTA domain-containing Ser/Thr kinase [Halalkalibacterium ligniniphilum]
MIGKRISGRYEILETIGGGGMADVYKARDAILDRYVAVKVLQPQFSKDEQFIKRFRREAQAATSLAHPNVVNIYDVGEEADLYYIVMEYVEGATLKELIQERGPLSLNETVDWMGQIMSAIAHAHENQIVHRDIKPHNILIRTDGVAKVTDFGIARAMSSATITHTNSVMGSVHYLSPEQARGGLVTFKSDIYSLGIVLYEMVTGQLPFSGDTAVSIAIKHLQNEMPSPRDLNPDLPQSIENIILRATAKDPFYRYETVQDMEEDLETALDPSRYDEAPFKILQDDEEITKAIPIITDKQLQQQDMEKTVEVIPPYVKMAKEKEDPTEAEPNSKPAKKNKRKRWLVILLVALFVLIGSTIAAFALFPSFFRVDEVEIPNVTEMEYEEAEQQITALNLQVEREDIFEDNDLPAGYVVRQNPAPGSMVKENSTVRLFVNGEQQEEMIDVVGISLDEAKRLLEQFKFQDIEYVARETNDVAPGIVLAQQPQANETITVNETTVYITYSADQEIRLRNLEGLHENDARAYLDDEQLSGRFSYDYSDSVAEGRVISQSPSAATSVSPGAEVQLVISRGPRPDPAPQPKQLDEPTQPEQPETRNHDVNQTIEVSEEDREAGRTFDVRIIYRDATTGGQDEVFVEETISETKTYRIPLRASREQSGSFDIYINGEYVQSSREYRY